MQGVNIAKASAAREKLLEAIQELTESGEITWLARIPGYEGTKVFTYAKQRTNLSLAIAHQQGRSWSGNVPNPVQEQYARELAARRTTGSRGEEANNKEVGK